MEGSFSTMSKSSLDADDSSLRLEDSPAVTRISSTAGGDKETQTSLPASILSGEEGRGSDGVSGSNGVGVTRPTSGKASRFSWSGEQKYLLNNILHSFVDILNNWKKYAKALTSSHLQLVNL